MGDLYSSSSSFLTKGSFIFHALLDKKAWSIESFGSFSSMPSILPQPFAIYSPFFHKKIWKSKASPRVNAFTWTVACNQLNAMDLLQKRRPYKVISPHICVLYREDGVNGNHICLHCKFSKRAFRTISSRECMSHE